MQTAEIRTSVTVPLRFADGFEATASVSTFRHLVDERGTPAAELRREMPRPRGDARRPAGAAAQRVPDRRCLRLGAVRLRSPVARGRGAPLRRGWLHSSTSARRDAASASMPSSTPTRCRTQGLDTYEANAALGRGEDERDYTAAAQMLQASGMPRIRLLTNNPDKVRQLVALGDHGGAGRAHECPPHRGKRPLSTGQARSHRPPAEPQRGVTARPSRWPTAPARCAASRPLARVARLATL